MPTALRPLALVALALAAPGATAQQQPWNPLLVPYPPGATIDWPNDPAFDPGAPFKKVRFGDFDGNFELDALVHNGGLVAAAYTPEIYSALEVLPGAASGVNDFAVLSGAGPAGEDAVLTVDVFGLHRHDYVPATGTFDATLLHAGRWRGARFVRTGDVDGQYGDDIYGINAAGDALLVLLDDGAGGWITGFSYVFAATVLDVRLIHWDADDTHEVVGMRVDGVEICDQQGATVYTRAHDEARAIAVLPRREIRPTDLLLWVAYHTPLGEVLHILGPEGEPAPVPLVLPPGEELPSVELDVFDARVGDVDGDGDDDLLLSIHAFQQAICLYNRRLPEPGDTEQLFWNDEDEGDVLRVFLSYTPQQSSAPNSGRPGVADLDDDGRVDVLCPLDVSGYDSNELRLLQDLPFLPGSGTETLGTSEAILHNAAYGREPALLPDVGYATLELEVPDKILEATNPVLDHIQVVIWRQDDEGVPVTNVGVANAVWRMATGGPDPPPYDRRYQRIQVPTYGADPDWPWAVTPREHYYAHVRFVAVHVPQGGPPLVIAASKNVACGMTITWDPTLQDETYQDYLLDLPTEFEPVEVHPGGGGEGGMVIGVDLTISRIPNFSDTHLPIPGDIDPTVYLAYLWYPL